MSWTAAALAAFCGLGLADYTTGEDPYVVKSYIQQMVTGLQGNSYPESYRIISTCKHFAGYDIENWHGNNRYGFNAIINTQDLAEYFMQPFQQCARDTKVGSIMCSYNAVNGVPSCANSYNIDTLLRGHWNWTRDENYITSDCTAIQNMFTDHHAFPDRQQTVAAAINAGVDVDCGMYNPTWLPSALQEGLFKESQLDTALTRLYSAQVKAGYFDPASSNPLRSVTWQNVSEPAAEQLALMAAEEGIVLLKNDGVLPMKLPQGRNTTILLLGGWANATTQMQGNYYGSAPYLHSPWEALNNLTDVNIITTPWYDSPLIDTINLQPDFILYVDGTDEQFGEGQDRNTVQWDNLQLDTINMVALTGIPTIVAHMGEQCDDSSLLSNPNVSAIVWAGYGGQDGGNALVNILTGKTAPAGRMPVTQYPANYVNQVAMTDMSLRPNATSGNPGRTYMWFDNATVPFGYGMHYTNFSAEITTQRNSSYDISTLVNSCNKALYTHVEHCPFLPSGLSVSVNNTGKTASDFVTLAFVTGQFGPQPYPLKSLVAYKRLNLLPPGGSSSVDLNITIGGLARHDESGNQILYPGQYSILIDMPTQATWNFTLTGQQQMLDMWPQPN